MTQPRHRRVKPHARLRRAAIVAAPIVAGAVGITAFAAGPGDQAESGTTATAAVTATPDRDSADAVSRSLIGLRPALLKSLVGHGDAIEEVPTDTVRRIDDPAAVVSGSRYLTTDLNVWTGPGEDFRLETVLPTGARVKVTGVINGAWAQIIYRNKARWVRAVYLSKDKPVDTVVALTGGVTMAACPLGDAVEAGLTLDAIRVYRSVCARFPEVTSYGGFRDDGSEHGEGRALDIMVSSSALGDAIAEWVRANASALGASEILWAQHIWTVERGSEGWRLFADRGSATANHYDHVHVTVYG